MQITKVVRGPMRAAGFHKSSRLRCGKYGRPLFAEASPIGVVGLGTDRWLRAISYALSGWREFLV